MLALGRLLLLALLPPLLGVCSPHVLSIERGLILRETVFRELYPGKNLELHFSLLDDLLRGLAEKVDPVLHFLLSLGKNLLHLGGGGRTRMRR